MRHPTHIWTAGTITAADASTFSVALAGVGSEVMCAPHGKHHSQFIPLPEFRPHPAGDLTVPPHPAGDLTVSHWRSMQTLVVPRDDVAEAVASDLAGVDNLLTLHALTEASILHSLRTRHHRNQIYVRPTRHHEVLAPPY